ncbi:MAG: alpha-mannosidase [Thermoproteota archaeon]
MKFLYHIVSETHWDREWYATFQQFRSRLVRMCDHLLKILAEDPNFKHFTLDGQTVVLEDYLEVKPEARDLLVRYVRDGRILIGPWYVLPDEFLEGAEAMVRNLMLGHKIASNFGAVMKVGYIPDTFGHIRQLPQILRGFGIDNAVVWRGVGEEIENTEFDWVSPDGSSVLAIYLPDGYCNAANLQLDPESFANRIEILGRRLRPMATTNNILLMNGCDHLEAQAGLPSAIDELNRKLKDAILIHSTIPRYIDAIKEAKPKLKIYSGEFRSPARAPLLVGVLSTRIWIKQLNERCEKLLERWAEPLAAWAWLVERKAPKDETKKGWMKAMNWLAWKYLLQNHPHDSICGCSIDDVHRDMLHRFKWVEEIANIVIEDCLQTLSDHIDTAKSQDFVKEGGVALIVFNHSAGPRTDVVRGKIEIGCAFDLLDDKKMRIDVQEVFRTQDGEKVEFIFVARDLLGYGYRVYYATPRRDREMPKAIRETSKEEIENEFYRVTIDKTSGTFNIIDKENGITYAGCNRFVDVGDAGDEYNFSPPEKNTTIDKPARIVECYRESGPVKETLEMRMVYAIPKSLSEDRGSRSSSLVEMPITTSASLYPGVRRIDFVTRVENTALDHWLRVRFPTGISTKKVYSEGHFDVLERQTGSQKPKEGWFEKPLGTFPQKSFTDVNDGTKGFLLANKGLPECEALEEEGGVTLLLTLLRCVGWLSRGDLSMRPGNAGPTIATPEAQCLGVHTFEYAVVPHRGSWEKAFHEAHNFIDPIRTIGVNPREGNLPSELSWIGVEPSTLVISAVKIAEQEDGIVVRVYNPTDSTIEGRLKTFHKIASAHLTNLNEEKIGDAELDEEGAIKLHLKPKAAVSTLLLF